MMQLHNSKDETPKRVLAIDPGATTGYALMENESITTGSFSSWHEFNRLIEVDTIVIVEEPFLKPTTNPIVFEVAGAAYERTFTITGHYALRQPAFTPTFMWTRYELEGKLKGNQHQKDALMHLMRYLMLRHDWTLEECLNAITSVTRATT